MHPNWHDIHKELMNEKPNPTAALTAFQIARECGSALPLDLPLMIEVKDEAGMVIQTCNVEGYDHNDETLTLNIILNTENLGA